MRGSSQDFADKALVRGFEPAVCIIMGFFTAVGGGMLRDTLINEVPLIFRKDIYASACVMGGLIYYACQQLGLTPAMTQFIAAASVFITRAVAVRYHISLPVLKGEE